MAIPCYPAPSDLVEGKVLNPKRPYSNFALRVSRDVIYLLRARKPVGLIQPQRTIKGLQGDIYPLAGIVKGNALNQPNFGA